MGIVLVLIFSGAPFDGKSALRMPLASTFRRAGLEGLVFVQTWQSDECLNYTSQGVPNGHNEQPIAHFSRVFAERQQAAQNSKAGRDGNREESGPQRAALAGQLFTELEVFCDRTMLLEFELKMMSHGK